MSTEYRGYLGFSDYDIERRFAKDGQPDSWVFEHKEYNGPPDRRAGYGPTLKDVHTQIAELEADREEMECAG